MSFLVVAVLIMSAGFAWGPWRGITTPNRHLKRFAIILTFMLLWVTPCFAQVFYQLDDGSAELPGITSGATREALALNGFDVVPGGEQIIRISGVWGSVANPGAPARVVLFSDPNNDGNPSDAQLLVQIPTTFGTTGSSFSVDIPPTVVHGKFFVGVVWLNPGGNLWLGYDTDTNSGGRSWFSSSNPGGTLNLNNLSSNLPYLVDNVNVIRAEGIVPTNNCAAHLSTNLILHIPILTFKGLPYWADFSYVANTLDFTLTNGGAVADTSSFTDCSPSTLSPDLKLHIPAVTYNNASYWLDMGYKQGLTMTVKGAGQN